jgi:large conductance mechanosensitive channel
MSSQGIGTDLRRLLLRGNVFALAIAVLVGTALFQLLYAAIEYVALPFARGTFQGRDEADALSSYQFYSNFHGYVVSWGEVVTLAVTLVLAALVVLFLRKRLAYADEGDDEFEIEEDDDLRACPQCLSLIPSAARRCAFCTAPVEPPESPANQLG